MKTIRADREIGCGVPHVALGPTVDILALSITEQNHYTKTQQALSFGLLAMSAQDFDPGQLSESQQLALETFTSVTNQEPSAAIPLLQRSEWNVQVCRRKRDSGIFGGLS